MNWYRNSQDYINTYGHHMLKVISASGSVGWVSLRIPSTITKKCVTFAKAIDDDDVYHEVKDGKEEYGLELEPHITIKYGIKTKSANKVRKLLETKHSGTVRLDKLNLFEANDYDVLKISVTGSILHRLHKDLTEKLNTPDNYPDYHPHLTIAYMKKGKADQYAGDETFKDMTFECEEVIFEDSDDKKTTIKLLPN